MVRAGARLASLFCGTVITALLGVPCSGCLVTEEYTFEGEPDLPPVILGKAGFPEIGKIVWIDNVRSEWRLQVQVRDENVGQELQAQWRVQHQEDMMPPFVVLDIPVSDGPIRELEIVVNTGNLLEYRCHRLELAVSGRFFGWPEPEFFGRVPLGDEADVARALWWIFEGQGPDLTPPAQQAAINASCPTVENLTAAQPSAVQPQGMAQ